MIDLDAAGGPLLHWQVSGIDPVTQQVDGDSTAPGATVGGHGLGGTGYAPPCPPAGEVHRYTLTLYALREPVDPPTPRSAPPRSPTRTPRRRWPRPSYPEGGHRGTHVELLAQSTPHHPVKGLSCVHVPCSRPRWAQSSRS